MEPISRVFIADENAERCQQLRNSLRDLCQEITICTSPLRALRRLRTTEPDVLLVAWGMRELDSREFIRRAKVDGRALNFALIGVAPPGMQSPDALVEGCRDFIELPTSEADIQARIQRMMANRVPPPVPAPVQQSMIISKDPAMKSILSLIELASRRDSRVLILGETGTGKQLVAQSVHEQSPRRQHPFVEINCAAIPENLLESELFGHERGAFSGATDRRVGRFEQADQGTLFLDEIGELSLGLQAKLLRVLQSGCFNRIGSNSTIRSNARVVAATNRDLLQEVEAGRFRADLYYRLNVITITLPALRHRLQDIPLLAEHFIRRHRGNRACPTGFSPEAMQLLQQHRWPGNIRELEHVVERLAVLHDHAVIGATDLPVTITSTPRDTEAQMPIAHLLQGTFATVSAGIQKLYLDKLLRRVGGNLNEAARTAGMPRSRLIAHCLRQGIDPTSYIVTSMMQAVASGNFAKASDRCNQAIEVQPRNPLHYYNLGCIEARQGKARAPQALAALRRAIELGFNQANVLATDSDWTEVRGEREFQDLIALAGRNAQEAAIHEIHPPAANWHADPEAVALPAPAPASKPALNRGTPSLWSNSSRQHSASAVMS